MVTVTGYCTVELPPLLEEPELLLPEPLLLEPPGLTVLEEPLSEVEGADEASTWGYTSHRVCGRGEGRRKGQSETMQQLHNGRLSTSTVAQHELGGDR